MIGSLNGTSNGGWIHYGKMIEEAGADALELNIYFLATDPETTALQVENQYLELVAGRPRGRLDPPGRQDRAVLQLDGQHGEAAVLAPAPTAWCSSTGSSSPTSTSRP